MYSSTIKSKSTGMLMLVLAAFVTWTVSGARPAANEEAYSGTVNDAMTGKPVGGMKVVVRRLVNGKPAGKAELASDTVGRFRIALSAEWVSQPEAHLAVDVETPRGYYVIQLVEIGSKYIDGHLRRLTRQGFTQPVAQEGQDLCLQVRVTLGDGPDPRLRPGFIPS